MLGRAGDDASIDVESVPISQTRLIDLTVALDDAADFDRRDAMDQPGLRREGNVFAGVRRPSAFGANAGDARPARLLLSRLKTRRTKV